MHRTDPDFPGARCSLPICFAVAVAVAALASAGEAPASQLLTPSVGAADAAMGSATMGDPESPSAAAFSNPASLILFEPGATSGSLGIAVGHSSFDASAPPRYDNRDGFTGYVPEGSLVFGGPHGIRAALALYGSLGASFDTDAQPAVGVPLEFLSRFAVVNVAANVAWKATERLSFGVGLSLLLGDVKLRYTTDIPYHFSVWGPGVQAIAGARYELTDAIALGLAIRSPGMVWADGDMRLPSGNKQDVELDLDQPSQIFVGVNADVTEKLHVGLLGRWTDASIFSQSWFRFEETPTGDVAFIADASDEWLIALGTKYALTERITLRLSASWADTIVGDRSVSPLLMDVIDWKIGGGFSLAWSPDFIIDVTAGHGFEDERDISSAEALIFPGEYRMSGQIVMLGFRANL
ncbi:MAG TPA: outer membrane protein transport protein [Candidatus Limnocylindrales bacterium]|nr:outer membrane protein transport protein [Candidatus Limnocylindrales bacterium]